MRCIKTLHVGKIWGKKKRAKVVVVLVVWQDLGLSWHLGAPRHMSDGL